MKDNNKTDNISDISIEIKSSDNSDDSIRIKPCWPQVFYGKR